MSDAPAAAPGWYPEHDNPGVVRYWNGKAWEDWRQPAVTPQPRPAMRNGLAVAAFVLGILSLLGFAFLILLPPAGVVPILAVIFGVLALRRWRVRGGRVFAHLGLWFGVATLPLLALGIASWSTRIF